MKLVTQRYTTARPRLVVRDDVDLLPLSRFSLPAIPTKPVQIRRFTVRLMAMSSPAAGVLAGIFLLVALYCGTDPFRHSALSGFPDFEAYRVDMPPLSEVPPERDSQNLLQRSEIKFLNQIQGPESIAFDPQGRGPYTGVADGRVLFWDGRAWSDFAYTSPNR